MSNTFDDERKQRDAELEELLERVAAWSQEGKPPAQYLYTALGWRVLLFTQEEEEGGKTWRHACPCASTQTPPSSSFSPYHTTSTPAGARQTVLLVRLFQKYVLPACFSLNLTHSTEPSS